MYEKSWKRVPPQSFIANGTTDGKVSVADASLFKVKQEIILTGNTLPNLELEVKRVENLTTLYVGLRNTNIGQREDISAYTMALAGAIQANEQKRSTVPEEQVERLTYEEEPVVARRVVLVDKLGDKYSTDNPLPVQLSDGDINIETLNAQLEVHLSHEDPDHDSVRIGDGEDQLEIEPDGSINVNVLNTTDTQISHLDPDHDSIRIGDGVEEMAVNPDGSINENISGWFGSTAPTVGQKTSANSIPVVLPSDQTIDVNVVNATDSQISHLDPDHDSIRIGDGVEEMAVNPDGSINTDVVNKLVKERYDEVDMDYDPLTQDMTEARFLASSTLVAKLGFTYDVYSNLLNVKRIP